MRFRVKLWSLTYQTLLGCVLISTAQAEHVGFDNVSDDDGATPPTYASALRSEATEAPVVESQPGSCCGNSCCGNSCCGNSCCGNSCKDIWFNTCNSGWGGVMYSGIDAFRGRPDGTGPGNFGGVTGINIGKQLGDSPWGVQFGGSVGIYDWKGRLGGNEPTISQTQTFFTGGIFRKATCDSRFSLGAVYDLMVNDNFGSASDEPYLTQFRLQAGYALNARNEIGSWVALADRNSTQTGRATFRAVNTYNFYLNHKFCNGASSFLWIGFPQNSRLGTAGGSLYSFTFGSLNVIPISSRLSGYGQVMYASPSAASGAAAAVDEAWNASVGFAFYPRCNARTCSVSGAGWMPYMPVANNGTFLTDASTAP